MDEATSDIDKSTEADINQALNKLTEDKTAITIAHRLDTIQNSDRIIVLRDGMIVETGSHKGLISHKGEYYNIYKNQFKE